MAPKQACEEGFPAPDSIHHHNSLRIPEPENVVAYSQGYQKSVPIRAKILVTMSVLTFDTDSLPLICLQPEFKGRRSLVPQLL